MTFGMTGRNEALGDCSAFELEPLANFAEWTGKLTIYWPKPYQHWWRWAGKGRFPVTAIESETRFVRAVPNWSEVVLAWTELSCLPRSWKTALAQWCGIYWIYDTAQVMSVRPAALRTFCRAGATTEPQVIWRAGSQLNIAAMAVAGVHPPTHRAGLAA